MSEKVIYTLTELSHQLKKTVKANRDKLLFGLTAFCFGLTPVGWFYPFGWALFTASEGYDGIMLGVMCLCCILGGGGLVGITVAIGLYAFKQLIPSKGASVPAKLIAAFAAAAFICIAQLENGAYSMAFGAVALMLVPVFTLLYGLYLSPGDMENTATRQAGLGAFVFTALLFLNSLLPWRLPVMLLALLITLVASREGGMLSGGFFGFICGLTCGAGCGAMLGVCGLCAGLLASVSELYAVGIGCFAGFCTGVYFMGAEYILQLLLCYTTAGVCYYVFGARLRLLPIYNQPAKEQVCLPEPSPFAEAFEEIAYSARIAAGNKDSATRAADDYAIFSKLLSKAKERQDNEQGTDAVLSQKAAIVLSGAGIRAEAVRVTGGRQKRMEAEGVAVEGIQIGSDRLKTLLEDVLGGRLKAPKFLFSGGKTTLRMESLPLYRIECARTGVCKEGEGISGDTVSFFSSESGYFYALISDGMGSGKEAAVSSRLASVFLEKLLLAGADRYSTLSLLNSYLAARETEVFATVDLLEVDLYTGKGVLVKAGAAPSCFVRNGKCNKLQSTTAPTGIMREVSAEQLSFSLKNGDMLVMFSDGLCGNGDGEEIAKLLQAIPNNASAATVASKLIEDGIKRNGKTDDISVCVIRVLAA